MGNLFSRLFSGIFLKENPRIVMLGLEGAGKTSILYQLKFDKIVTTIPIIGLNVDTIYYKNFSLSVWDIGGPVRVRPPWRYYYHNCVAVIFVVDSNDSDRVSEARDDLERVLSGIQREEEARADAPLLVYANKQDLQHAMTVAEVRDAMNLNSINGREWHIQGTVARTGEGV
ncbi:hypothetical protein BGZ49_005918, partial [Haplosporangium sp. Z 27]